jgi:hypothetical protein
VKFVRSVSTADRTSKDTTKPAVEKNVRQDRASGSRKKSMNRETIKFLKKQLKAVIISGR